MPPPVRNMPSAASAMRGLPVASKQLLDKAQLPALYVAAVSALKAVHNVDELKDIEDKHSAIAHYAKQIKDKELVYYAERVRLRAFVRLGELLAELKDEEAAIAHAAKTGMQRAMAQKALDIKHIPVKVLNKLIDQNPPISRTQLAAHAVNYKPTAAIFQTQGMTRYLERERSLAPSVETLAVDMHEWLRDIAQDLKTNLRRPATSRNFSLHEIARAIHPTELRAFRDVLTEVMEMLDQLDQAIAARE